jgi:branched-chain amino acid transport system permease protein
MTVADNVVVGAYVHARTDAAARAAATRAIEDVGLAESAALVAGGIGNKALRLMELARALASKPRVLLLDEIFAGLSHTEIDELMIVIRGLNARGITIAIIEHTMRAMVQLVDRFVVLDHGAVLTEGAPAAITRDPAVIEAYLGKKWLADA